MKGIYRLNPTLHNNIWGGNKLKKYGKVSDLDRIGESWELSFVPGNEATVEGGATTKCAFPREAWGKNCESFPEFPVLTKFIDAEDNLSVQVHPSDDYALTNEGQYGKTEMWYVVEAEAGAGLYMGLTDEMTKEEFSRAICDNTIEDKLAFVEVSTGDVFFIPSGTIHAIGKGTLIFEIQQNSTLTYRIYDYKRRQKDGSYRELHVEKAKEVSILKPYESAEVSGENVIGCCNYFTTKKHDIQGKCKLKVTNDSYLSLTCVSGAGEISYGDTKMSVSAGDSFFIPAHDAEIEASGDMTLIGIETGARPQ